MTEKSERENLKHEGGVVSCVELNFESRFQSLSSTYSKFRAVCKAFI